MYNLNKFQHETCFLYTTYLYHLVQALNSVSFKSLFDFVQCFTSMNSWNSLKGRNNLNNEILWDSNLIPSSDDHFVPIKALLHFCAISKARALFIINLLFIYFLLFNYHFSIWFPITAHKINSLSNYFYAYFQSKQKWKKYKKAQSWILEVKNVVVYSETTTHNHAKTIAKWIAFIITGGVILTKFVTNIYSQIIED